MENRPENHLPITDGETDFAKSWFSESARLTEERMRACETAKAESEGRSPAFPEVRLRSVCRNTNAVFVEVEKRTFFMFGENYGKLYQSIFSTYVVQRRLENPGDEKREWASVLAVTGKTYFMDHYDGFAHSGTSAGDTQVKELEAGKWCSFL